MSALMGHHVSPYFGEWVVSVRALCSVNSSSCFLVDVFGILGAERRCSLLCVVDFWESNNRQTFHKHFSLLFGAFFNAMVICSMFDFYFGKKTGKIPKPNNSFKLGRLQNKNKAGSIFSLIMRFWAGLHTIFLFTLAWNVSIFRSCQCVWILDWIDFIHMG